MDETTEKGKAQRNRKRIYEMSPEEASVPEEASEPATMESVTIEETVDLPVVKSSEQKCDELYRDALKLVRKSSAWAAGVGLLPIPVVDVVAMTAVQIAMLKKLAAIYGIPFNEQRSKSAVAALIGGLNAGYVGGSALKMFPLFGVLSLTVMPVANMAITYAVGRVFIQHFAIGGTFLDFDPVKVRAYFEEQFREGKLLDKA
ncbi:MAG: YcjF family protein [Pedobacter sp.]